jgi:hypothetical protein
MHRERGATRVAQGMASHRDAPQGDADDVAVATAFRIADALALVLPKAPQDRRLRPRGVAATTRSKVVVGMSLNGSREVLQAAPFSRDQDDFADVAPLGDEAVRVGRTIEREGRGDDRLELTRLERR